MSNSRPSAPNRGFLAFASLIIVLTAGLAYIAWPAVLSSVRASSLELSRAGDQAVGSEAELDYELAYLLDDHNAVASWHVAGAQLKAGNYRTAFSSIRFAGSSREAERVRLAVMLENGRYDQAVQSADRLAGGAAPEEDMVLASLAYGVGERSAKLTESQTRLTSPQALQSLRKVIAGNVPLSDELRARGLPVSSRAILTAAPVSIPRNSRLIPIITNGRDLMALSAAELTLVTRLQSEILTIDPADISVRRSYVAALKAQKNLALATNEQDLVNKLESGKP